jgi:hypothetical protein
MRNVTRTAVFAAAVAATAVLAVGCDHAKNAASSASSIAASAAAQAGAMADQAGIQAGSMAQSGVDRLEDKFANGGSEEIKTPAGEIAVEGAIGQKYEMLGGRTGPLGMPRSPEQDGPNGGKYQAFTGGDVYWSQTTGAHNVWGDIMAAWKEHGGPGGALGYPTTDEKDSANGGKEAHFTGGTIAWTDGQATVATH